VAGRIQGTYFKLVIGNLLSVRILFPEYKRRIDGMSPTGLYPWAEYTAMMQAIARELPTETMVQVGKKIVKDSKAYFASQGFDTAERILGDWAALMAANVLDLPPDDLVQTQAFSQGSVVIVAGAAQPAALVEGYMRGVAEMFGHRVTRFAARSVVRPSGASANELQMSWA